MPIYKQEIRRSEASGVMTGPRSDATKQLLRVLLRSTGTSKGVVLWDVTPYGSLLLLVLPRSTGTSKGVVLWDVTPCGSLLLLVLPRSTGRSKGVVFWDVKPCGSSK
jgi:hypothetical protein